jgi:surface protein
MFSGCSSLQSLDLRSFNTSKVTSMNDMFGSCQKLISLNLDSFNTSNVTDANYMFQSCKLLETITNIDLIKATKVNYMFNNCSALKNLTVYNIKKSFIIGSDTSYGTLLTLDSLVHTIQQLWDLTGSTSQTLTMSTASKNLIANVYVKLVEPTAEQIEADPNIIYKKNCVVCESTDAGAMTITEYATSKNWTIA